MGTLFTSNAACLIFTYLKYPGSTEIGITNRWNRALQPVVKNHIDIQLYVPKQGGEI